MSLNTKTMYVVTRRGRRVEPQNYEKEADAQRRARSLVEMLKEYSPLCSKKVGIVKTKNPNTIT
jgi:hypothetical protein